MKKRKIKKTIKDVIGEVFYKREKNKSSVRVKAYRESKKILFVRWLFKVSRTPEGEVPPKWLRAFHWVLFPKKMIGLKYTPVKWDPPTNVYTIEGLKFSGRLFDLLGYKAKRKTIFRLIEREDGVVTVEEINSQDTNLTSKEFIKKMYKSMVEVDEKANGSRSFGDTLHVVWSSGKDEYKSTKEIMEYLIQNDL